MMRIVWIAMLLFALVGSAAVPSVVGAEGEPHATTGPPELGIAVVVDGRALEVRRYVKRMVTRTTTSALPRGIRVEATRGTIGPASRTEVVPVIEVHITRVDSTKVVARRIDGREVSRQVMMDELARPTPVVVAKQGQELDPWFAKVFKPKSLVLLLPLESAVARERDVEPKQIVPN